MKLRVLIVDDEPLARESIRAFLSAEAEIEVVGEAADGREAVETILQEKPDLVFLDVDMPELNGFGVLESIPPQQMPVVIFVTAHEQHAVQAFEVDALDYLVKPFGLDRFQRSFRRARTIIEEQTLKQQSDQLYEMLEQLSAEQRRALRSGAKAGDGYLERLMVKANGRISFLRTREIEWVEAEGNYVRLHLGKSHYLIRETMNALEAKLDPQQFARVHRSTIVNLDHIKELRPWFAGDYILVLKDGTELKLSRSYRERLEEKIGRYL